MAKNTCDICLTPFDGYMLHLRLDKHLWRDDASHTEPIINARLCLSCGYRKIGPQILAIRSTLFIDRAGIDKPLLVITHADLQQQAEKDKQAGNG